MTTVYHTNFLRLYFYSGEKTELVHSEFNHVLLSEPVLSTRGRNQYANSSQGSFQWTNAVKSLSIFFIRAASILQSNCHKMEGMALLHGTRGSVASSLDFALGKEPDWLAGMFGSDVKGRPLIKKIIARVNPEMRRAGPVILSLNTRFFDHGQVEIFVDELPVLTAKELAVLERAILAQFPGGEDTIPFLSPTEERAAA